VSASRHVADRRGCRAAERLRASFAGISKISGIWNAKESRLYAGCAGVLPVFIVGLASMQEVRRYYNDRTHMSYSKAHGPQVEYSTADGRVFLWYPGNTAILPGRWRVEETNPVIVHLAGRPEGSSESRRLTKICFQYGADSYNPVTRHQGADWECTLYAFAKATDRESRVGDVFGLASGKLPFVLDRDETTIEALLKMSKKR
jgi:hypothetical protein